MATPRQRAFAVLGAVLMVTAAFGVGGAAAQDGDAPAEIDSCTEITEPGRYVLTADVANATGVCIQISADDVVLDGDGHSIEGVQTESELAEFRNASLTPSVVFSDEGAARNGTVAEVFANYPTPSNPRWANVGIAANASTGLSNVTVRDVRVSQTAFGVYVDGVSDARIENVTAEGNGDGIELYNSTGAAIERSRLVDNQWGLFAANATGVTASGITAEGNDVNGLTLYGSPNATVSESAISGSPLGAQFVASNGSAFADSTVSDSAYTGLGVISTDRIDASNATISNTTGTVPGYLAEYPAPFDASAAVSLDGASEGQYRNLTLEDSAEWAFHAANGSSDNAGISVGLDGLTVGFVATDAAIRPATDEVGNGTVGDGVIAASTGEDGSITLGADWNGGGVVGPAAIDGVGRADSD